MKELTWPILRSHSAATDMLKKINLKINKSQLIATTAVIFISASVILSVYLPFKRQSLSFRSDILAERENNILLGHISVIHKYLDVYKKQIPDISGVSAFMGDISEMARKENVEIISIKPGAPEITELYTKFYVTLDIKSPYKQLGSFVSRIESSDKFFMVEGMKAKRLDMERDVKDKSDSFKAFDVTASLVLSAYSFKEDKGL